MQIGVYKSSGGKDIVLNGNYSPEAVAKIYYILKKLCENGLDGFFIKPVNKNSTPKLYEIKWERVRLFYFLENGNLYITHITEHKQKNKTELCDKATATKRIKYMLNNPNEHVAWL